MNAESDKPIYEDGDETVDRRDQTRSTPSHPVDSDRDCEATFDVQQAADPTARFDDRTMAPDERQVASDDQTFVIQNKERTSKAAQSPESDIPQTIGRYQIVRLLGEGAFGRVYQAHDPQLDRSVAIKVAKSLSGKNQVERFLREARAAAQLRHPNIIPVYEYGQVDDENIIVYEFVPGETLKSFLLRHQPVDLGQALEIVRQIAQGLNYAHQQGIIHRDMKPDNVLIDEQGCPHIADFGCARSMDDQTSLTIEGSILGTPMYMSPEQAGGKSNVADGRTDIWSLGVMLYEMVAGQRPFRGKLSDLLYAICNHDAKPLRRVSPGAPADLETICEKCLTRDLDKRFQSAGMLADELERFQRGEPIESRRIGMLLRTWMWARRNRAVAGLLAVVALALLIGTTVSSRFAYLAYQERRDRAMTQMNQVTTSASEKLPEIFKTLKPFRATVLPRLKQRLTAVSTEQEKYRLQMAILELAPDLDQRTQVVQDLTDYLLTSDAGDFHVCRQCLDFRKSDLSRQLWKMVLHPGQAYSTAQQFRASAALAAYDPESPDWKVIAPKVASYLLTLNPIEMSAWVESFKNRNVRERLKPTLVAAFAELGDGSEVISVRAASVLSLLYSDQSGFLVSLIPQATSRQLPLLTDALKVNPKTATGLLKNRLSQIQQLNRATIGPKSNLVIALLQLGDSDGWKHFDYTTDGSVVANLIERLGPALMPVEPVLNQIENWQALGHRSLGSLLLSLGQFRSNQISLDQKERMRETLLAIFTDHADARVHSCARWLLVKWNFERQMRQAERQLRRLEPESDKNWHVDMAGNTFALFGPVESFEMGMGKALSNNQDFDLGRFVDENLHRKQIPRRFGICIHEVTIAQYETFEQELIDGFREQLNSIRSQQDELRESKDPDNDNLKKVLARNQKKLELALAEFDRHRTRRENLDKNLPISNVNFYFALAYCRWLCQQQQTESGMPAIEELRKKFQERGKRDIAAIGQSQLAKQGYRLPTTTEWEYACRGSSHTLFPYGQNPGYMERYAWFANNSEARLHPVARLKPDNSGLFDMLGNASEWCLDWYREELPELKAEAGRDFYIDAGPEYSQHQGLDRELRGGSFRDELIDLRPTRRHATRAFLGFPRIGFRLARTYGTE